MSDLFDAAARRTIREELDKTLVVEAAAGTGKTTEMIKRIIAVIETGVTTLECLVAVTFTEKAAGEMKLRLRTELESQRAKSTGVARERLEQALAALEVARIGSIHSFCADLLRERPIEARVDPLFEVAAEDETERLYNQAFDSWFQHTLADPPEGVRRILRRNEPTELLRKAGWGLVDRRDFNGAWRRDPFDRNAAIDQVLRELFSLTGYIAMADKPDKDPARLFARIQRWREELTRLENVRARDHDGLEAELGELFRWWEWRYAGRGTMYGAGLTRADVILRRDAVKLMLEEFLQVANADLAACLHAELRPLVADYERIKARTGKLDFLDLLAKTRDLLRDDPTVRVEMQARYTHFFVDEFQDTDPLQVEILLLLCSDDTAIANPALVKVKPGKLFVVGDPKQAIYRFRRADIALYEAIKERLVKDGATLLHLTTSFRAVPAIQTAINTAFEPIMQGDGQATYVPLVKHRADSTTQPAVIALPVPEPYGKRDVSNYAIEKSYPDAVGAFIEQLMASSWTVPDRDGKPTKIDSKHICLMFRRFQTFGRDLTRPYVKALEARGIAHVLVGGRSFHEREEIEAARNALRAIEWPDDEFSVYATLRGPFFAFHDEDLVAFRYAHGRLNPVAWIEKLAPGEHEPVISALRILGVLHRGRNRRPIAATLMELLSETRAHAGIAIWPAGEQALANLLRVTDLARRFESGGATSFRAFIDRLDTDADRGRSPDAPVVEEGTEGVRIMTVHKAKGLEFPVVILCDPTAPLAPSEPSHYVDTDRRLWLERIAGCVPTELREHAEEVIRRDREEEQRLAYVAVTRARDLLVVPVVGDEERDGWLEALNPIVIPAVATKRTPGFAGNCPRFGEDSVLDRPRDCERMPHDSVMPGLHVPRAGTHQVVWWDPHVLKLGVEIGGGMRQQHILEADESGELATASVAAHVKWQMRRAGALIRSLEPSLHAKSVTEASRLELLAELDAPVAIEATPIDRVNRPNGRRFGSLVHAVLAAIDLAGDDAHVRAVAVNQARLIDASPDEIDAAVVAVRAALAHPLMQRAAAARILRREIPIVHDTPGLMLEGIIDLAFADDAGWFVIDYKTDPELNPEVRAPYEAQVRAYARAITAATSLPASAALLLI